jgi:3-oxoacyl-[acyl-carrier protein] reductase
VHSNRDHASSTDRVAIVTNGSRGVGRKIAHTLAGQGYAVAISYFRNLTAAEAAVEQILATNGIALAIRADLADELDVERLFSETAEAFAGVDAVVHAAGHGTFVVGREACRHLRGGGALVNVSSSADTASTGAIETLTRELARELQGRDVTVNAVAYRLEASEVIAAAVDVVAFLLGSDARSINGQVIRVDGPGPPPGATMGTTILSRRDRRNDQPTEVTMSTMDVAGLAELLHETAEHHDPFEKAAPKHDWWDWYAAYMNAREHGSPPEEASDAARRYMEEVRHVVLPR